MCDDEVVLMDLPELYTSLRNFPKPFDNTLRGNRRVVLRLKRPLYGTKQGAHHWYKELRLLFYCHRCNLYYFFSSALIQHFQGMMEMFKALKPSQEKDHSISSLKSDIVVPKREHIVEPSQLPLGPLQKMPTPLPADKNDYPDAVYWTQQSWQDYSQQREQKGEKVKKLGFICTEDGGFVGSVRIKTMTETAKKLWNHLHHYRLAPATWRLISQDAYDYFSNHMRTTYPEFRLCESDWKAKIFGMIRYLDWSHGPCASGTLTCLYLVFLMFCLIFFVSGAIPSIDTHTGSSLGSGQSKDK